MSLNYTKITGHRKVYFDHGVECDGSLIALFKDEFDAMSFVETEMRANFIATRLAGLYSIDVSALFLANPNVPITHLVHNEIMRREIVIKPALPEVRVDDTVHVIGVGGDGKRYNVNGIVATVNKVGDIKVWGPLISVNSFPLPRPDHIEKIWFELKNIEKLELIEKGANW